MKVLGIDVSKGSVTVCLLDDYPDGGIEDYWKGTRNALLRNYPQFYAAPSSKKGQSKQKNAFDFAEFVKASQPDFAVIEPTGNHYSRLWATILQALGVEILWVGHAELRTYRKGQGLPAKTDQADALALAGYPLEPRRWKNGKLNFKHFLIHRPYPIDELRELCQQLEHLNRVQSPIINYARQLLAWQFPEKAGSDSSTTLAGMLPPLWGWLADRLDRVHSIPLGRIKSAYSKSIASAYGIEISNYLREHAGWLCDIQDSERRIETKLIALLEDPCFDIYHQVFDQFGFGLRIRANILSRIYPFESFLTLNLTEWIEYVTEEVGTKKRSRSKDGRTIVTTGPTEEKRCKRNRHARHFQNASGYGHGVGAIWRHAGGKS